MLPSPMRRALPQATWLVVGLAGAPVASCGGGVARGTTPAGGALLGLLLGLAACQRPADDRLALEALSSGPDEARALCRQIRDPELKSWCFADIARLHGAEDPARARADCTALPQGAWRNECFFLVAEAGMASPDPGAPLEAARDCGRSGPLAANCVMHLWSVEARRLMGDPVDWADPDQAAAFPARVAEATAGFESALAWATEAGLKRDRKLEDHAWAQFFQEILSSQEALDTAPCEALPTRARNMCRQAGGILLRQRLSRARQGVTDNNLAARCADLLEAGREPPDGAFAAISLGMGVRYLASPSLDNAAGVGLRKLCADAGP